ncbi:MAG: YjjG family noncanonical pyrimidine nucleotidase [Clostridia bacterium]|nr:YjjG family noncanonical pyrimidine nucleotidase [Clostridia bacterium]
MKQYKALFFDFDDTLFDFKPTERLALETTFRHYDIELSQFNYALYEAQNQAYWRGFEKGVYKNQSDSVVRFVNFTRQIGREDIDAQEMCAYFIDALSTSAFEIDNSVELLKKLSENYDIYLVTNALKRVNDRRCEVAGILPYIKGRFVSEAIGVSKPQKGFFDYCFEHIPYQKEEVLLIGDSLVSDIKGGVNYGLDTCWFNRFHKPNKEHLPITYEIYSLGQLERLLK